MGGARGRRRRLAEYSNRGKYQPLAKTLPQDLPLQDPASRPLQNAMALPSMLRLALVAIAAARQVSVSRHMALTIGDATHNVFDFGAAGDGETDDTAALQAAINACAKTGGLAVVPAGHTFVITSVTLNVSHTGLQIDGALKVGRPRPTRARARSPEGRALRRSPTATTTRPRPRARTSSSSPRASRTSRSRAPTA